MNKLKLAACGVICNECATYNKGYNMKAAESLVEWQRERGWIEVNEGAEAVQKNPPFVMAVGGATRFAVVVKLIFACVVSKRKSTIAVNVVIFPANLIKNGQIGMTFTKKQWNICYH